GWVEEMDPEFFRRTLEAVDQYQRYGAGAVRGAHAASLVAARCNPAGSGRSYPPANRSATLRHMRHATVLLLLLASAGCAHQRVRSPGETAHDPFIWGGRAGISAPTSPTRPSSPG